jgi:abequosyltransferase
MKLSVCIPTYNRAKFLGETLESVICQAEDDVEIVVVDGASTDNTKELIEGYQEKFRNLVYYRGERNSGVDRDMARSIELASGKYCWMLSDDDMLKPGAIKRILNEIKSECEIYLCNVTVCDFHMRPLRERFWLSRKTADRIFELHVKNEFIEYCNKANSIGALFSYMSSIVLCREEWCRVGYRYDFDRTVYALASSLLSFVGQKCRLKYIKDPQVLWRNDNVSFQDEGGLVKRFLLDFDGYLQLADKCLPDDQGVRDSFLRVMKREHPWHTIIHVASFIDTPELWRQFRAKLFKFGYSHRMVAICYVLGRHRGLVSLAVAMKRKIVKNHYINKVAGLLHHK